VEVTIVLVTTSSEFQDDGRLVSCALEAPAEEPVHVVATLPSGDATRLRAAVRRAIGCTEGARRVAEGYRVAGGAVAAADALEALTPAGSAGRRPVSRTSASRPAPG
jgi:hypothetical protein